MAETVEIVAEVRERAGKGAARAVRRENKIPAVIYGDKKPPLTITLDGQTITQLLRDPAFRNQLYSLKVDGDKHQVLVRDLQLDPVRDEPIHLDFLRVSQRTEITIEIPVSFVNEDDSPGLKAGGVLNVVRYTIEVSCRADSIPEGITIDLTGTELGDSIHISSVTLPDGVRPTISDRDFTVATIAAPSGLKAEEEEEAELEEGIEGEELEDTDAEEAEESSDDE
ncbi:MAG: 50S ribosomal protein L25/general stress protein Ctc [Pseudomonadota bacterium]